jgi:dihydroneopterin aldolase
MDKIIIKDLRLYAYHGVNPEEKIEGQNFLIDMECKADLSLPCKTDNVDDTVSYAQIIKLVRKVFTEEKYDLIEKAAQVIADSVLESFEKVKSIKVTLKKPEAPMKADFEYVAVQIKRERE